MALAYDFVVGKGATIKYQPVVVGTIEFGEIATLLALRKRVDTPFLATISAYMTDAEFSLVDIERHLEELHNILPLVLPVAERALLHKLIAVVSYAAGKRVKLFGVAD